MTLNEMLEQPTGRRAPASAASPLRLPLSVLGVAAGLAAGSVVYDRGWTWPGVVLAFTVVSGIVGSLLPDAIMGPRRIARVLYRSLPIVGGVGGFALAALDWGPTWASLLAGGALGAAAGVGLGFLLFRDLALEDFRPVRSAETPPIGTGRRDALLMLALIVISTSLALVGVDVLVYALVAAGFAVLLLISALAGVRERKRARR